MDTIERLTGLASGASDDRLGSWLAKAWSTPPRLQTLDVARGGISVGLWGTDATCHEPLVFLHGFRASAAWWDHVAPHFAAHARVAAIDLAGMGDNNCAAPFSIERHAQDLLDVLDALNLRGGAIVAHSFGVQVSYRACVLDSDPAADHGRWNFRHD